MDSKNKKILDEIGTESPFKVPQNYFDAFAKNMEEQLTEKKLVKQPLLIQLKPYLYFAASFVVVLFSVSIVFRIASSNEVLVESQPAKDSIALVAASNSLAKSDDSLGLVNVNAKDDMGGFYEDDYVYESELYDLPYTDQYYENEFDEI